MNTSYSYRIRVVRSAALVTAIALTAIFAASSCAESKPAESQSLAIVQEFMGAMGKGDMEKFTGMMAEDMVWHNEGDTTLPWIGTHRGKAAIMSDYLQNAGANMKTLSMSPSAMFADGNKVGVFGQFEIEMIKTGKKVKSSFAILIEVDQANRQIKSWNFHEDSFGVARAYQP